MFITDPVNKSLQIKDNTELPIFFGRDENVGYKFPFTMLGLWYDIHNFEFI